MFDLEYAYLYGANFDEIMSGTTFEWVIDGRKPAPERYMGYLTEDCI